MDSDAVGVIVMVVETVVVIATDVNVAGVIAMVFKVIGVDARRNGVGGGE